MSLLVRTSSNNCSQFKFYGPPLDVVSYSTCCKPEVSGLNQVEAKIRYRYLILIFFISLPIVDHTQIQVIAPPESEPGISSFQRALHLTSLNKNSSFPHFWGSTYNIAKFNEHCILIKRLFYRFDLQRCVASSWRFEPPWFTQHDSARTT